MAFLGIKSPKIVSERYVIDTVRLGEHDLRQDPDCQMVNDGNSHIYKPFSYRLLLFLY